jgi:titin
MDVKREDSGTYVLQASNALGQEEARIDLKVEAHAQAVDTTTMHAKSLAETKKFEMKQTSSVVMQQESVQIAQSKPVFVTPLKEPQPVTEGQNIHLEARLEPIGDPSVKVSLKFLEIKKRIRKILKLKQCKIRHV